MKTAKIAVPRHLQLQEKNDAALKEVMNTPDILKQIYISIMRLVPLYDGEEIIGEAPCIGNLDQWDGIRWCFGRRGDHLGIGNLDDGRFYACYSSEHPEGVVRKKLPDDEYQIIYGCRYEKGLPAIAVVISKEEAEEMVQKYGEGRHEAVFDNES